MIEKNILMVGTPSTGKSTFLAALWHGISGENENFLLERSQFSHDNSDIDELTEKWLKFLPLPRTTLEEGRKISTIYLKDQEDVQYKITCPDLSGEVFLDLCQGKPCGEELADCIQDADGILLFCSVAKLLKSVLMYDYEKENQKENLELESELHQAEEVVGEKVIEKVTEEESSQAFLNTDDFSSRIPTDVCLVELLRQIRKIRQGKIFSLTIVVSAWDILGTEGKKGPKEFVCKEFPLLTQYMNHNINADFIKYYGISAQGGCYEKDLDKMLECNQRSELITVMGEDKAISPDITKPIYDFLR